MLQLSNKEKTKKSNLKDNDKVNNFILNSLDAFVVFTKTGLAQECSTEHWGNYTKFYIPKHALTLVSICVHWDRYGDVYVEISTPKIEPAGFVEFGITKTPEHM